ncbi:MAG: hypothetical protein ACOH2A_02700 [Sphingobacteriaceae bacterium]
MAILADFKTIMMRTNLFKTCFFPAVISVFLLLSAIGCKKGKLEVKEVREFIEDKQISPGDVYGGAMHLTLNPDDTADIVPGGDISYRGTYKINGASIKVKTQQNSGSYTFEIISEEEIKSKEYGTVLKLKNN